MGRCFEHSAARYSSWLGVMLPSAGHTAPPCERRSTLTASSALPCHLPTHPPTHHHHHHHQTPGPYPRAHSTTLTQQPTRFPSRPPPPAQDSWSKTTAIIYVTAAQMLCGIAKDLTKLGGKTVTKLVTPEEKQVLAPRGTSHGVGGVGGSVPRTEPSSR